MKQRLSICVSPTKDDSQIAAVRCMSVRERILRFLLGSKEKLTIIVLGDSVKELAIHEVKEGSN